MTILGVEFSSPRRSVAIRRNGLTAQASEMGGRNTAALGMVEKVLAESRASRGEIEALVVGLGPGSYTGIRTAIALAQGWQLAVGVKLFGASSADAIAASAIDDDLTGEVAVVIDAQRNEFYLATYVLEGDGFTEVTPLRIASLAEVQACADKHLMIGPEITRWIPQGRVIFPSAAALVTWPELRKEVVSGDKLEPIYLRETAFVKAPPSRIVTPPE